MADPRQVIRSVSSRGYQRSRLVFQSICGSNGRRYLRAVHQYQGEDGVWHSKSTPPEFNAAVWTDIIAQAAASGMLSSVDYKTLLVRLAQGLDSSRNPTPKAFVRFTGHLELQFSESFLTSTKIDEVSIYESLAAVARDLTVTQAYEKKAGEYKLTYEVVEDIHYMEALSRLPDALREQAARSSMEEAVQSDPQLAFVSLFGEPGLASAGFADDSMFSTEYRLTVL